MSAQTTQSVQDVPAALAARTPPATPGSVMPDGNPVRPETAVVQTDKAAAPIGPYSQAIVANGFVFVAGEKGLDPATGKIVPGGVGAETRQTLTNVQHILEAAGSSLDRAVQTFVYLVDIDDFAAMNGVYAEFFGVKPPGRTTVAVSALPAGARVEITVTALG